MKNKNEQNYLIDKMMEKNKKNLTLHKQIANNTVTFF